MTHILTVIENCKTEEMALVLGLSYKELCSRLDRYQNRVRSTIIRETVEAI